MQSSKIERIVLDDISRRRQNETRIPPLITRPARGAQASTVQRPSTSRAGRAIGSQRVWRTSVRFSPLTNSRQRPNRRSPREAERRRRARSSIDRGWRRAAVRRCNWACTPTRPRSLGGHRRDQARAVPRRERNVAAAALPRPDVHVCAGHGERRPARRAEELDAARDEGLGFGAERVRRAVDPGPDHRRACGTP